MIRIEFDVDNVSLENILPIVYDKFDENNIMFDIRKIECDIEFILRTDFKDLDVLLKQIDFINIVFNKHCIITIKTNNLQTLKYHEITKFNDKNIKYLDCIVDDFSELNGYDMYRLKVNYIDLKEYNIEISIYSGNVTQSANEQLFYIVSNKLENIRKGDLITKVN